MHRKSVLKNAEYADKAQSSADNIDFNKHSLRNSAYSASSAFSNCYFDTASLILITERCHFSIRFIVFDHAGITFFGTRQITESGDSYIFTQVYDYLVRIFRLSRRTPVSRFLQVEYFIGCEITTISFFTVCINYFPMLTGERFAVFVQQIEFSKSSNVFTILCIECFQTEMTSLYRCIEFYFLPTVTRL